MKIGQTLKIKGEEYKIIKEFTDAFLLISEFGFNLKRIPKLIRVK